jgi:hypothetical protein
VTAKAVNRPPNRGQSTQATKLQQRQRHLKKASNTLGKILRRKLGDTSGDCLRLLATLIGDVLDTLRPLIASSS